MMSLLLQEEISEYPSAIDENIIGGGCPLDLYVCDSVEKGMINMRKIDLSGRWKLFMDKEKNTSFPESFNDEIILPNTTSAAKKGEPNTERASGYLTDPYKFEDYAWYSRDIEIKKDYLDNSVYLKLERTRKTTLYIDGEKIESKNSLSTPHLYELEGLSEGVHNVTVCVDNTDYPTRGGHLTSPDTQTNWNGITGEISLIIRPKIHLDDIRIYTDAENNALTISCVSTGHGIVTAEVDDGRRTRYAVIGGENVFVYLASEKLSLWDEFEPNLHTLKITMNNEIIEIPFGMRKISSEGRKLLVNGNETFLRGKHDGLIFPMTGYAPTTVEEWLKVMKTARDFGINHYRFHTCCPPEAAFIAADMLGIYMQPELPFWGTVKDEIDEEQQYLIDEGFRILKEFGNHPSFVMMSLGNELWGNKNVLSIILKSYKNFDNRHLYSDGSNNFQFVPCVVDGADFLSGVRLSHDRLYRGSYAMCDAPQGHIQTDAPNSSHNYDKIIVPEALGEGSTGGKILIQYGTGVKEVDADGGDTLIPQVPVISHEVGQYETYPDYSEIEKYTGALKAENIALYKEKAEEKGLISYSDKFFRASGALAADCYKREIEAALKSENLSGFQLLDIQDFTGQGTALVGVLNSFMEPKGTISDAEWRGFCNSTVIMAEFDSFVFRYGEEISFGLTLFNTDYRFNAEAVGYRILKGEDTVLSGKTAVITDKKVNKLGNISFNPEKSEEPSVYRLLLEIEDTDIRNEYTFIVYPEVDISIDSEKISYKDKEVFFVKTEAEAVKLSQEGKKAVVVPDSEGKLSGTYCTDFWCYPMFSSISESMNRPLPIGTMGCLIDKESPKLKGFPTETFSTPQWFNIIMHSHSENLDGTDIEPVIWAIDNPHRAQRLGVLYEKDGVTVLTSRLWEISEKPEVRYFAKCLVENV